MARFRSMSAAAAIGTAAALLAAACGGGGDTTGETPPPAATIESGAPAATGAAGETLAGTVGPGFTITLTQDGQPVTSLPAGTYEITVDDQSSSHDFHLAGPGVDEATDVGGTGTTTWTVTLEPGEYTYVCDPHASSMNGRFTVS